MPYFTTVRDYLVPPELRRGPALYAPDLPVDVEASVPFCRPQALEALQARLRGFFGDPDNFARLRSFLERPATRPAKRARTAPEADGAPDAASDVSSDSVSLRILDFLCTDYREEIREDIRDEAPALDAPLHEGYQNMLKSYSKNLFDVFARGPRVSVQGQGGKPLVTTYGQLNFFRWAIQHGVLDQLQSAHKSLRDNVRHALRKRTLDDLEELAPDRKRARAARVTVRFGGPFSPFR